MKSNKIINVTKTYLPPLAEYTKYLEIIWKSCQVTNQGPLVLRLESRLKKYLGVENLLLVSNGTIGLQVSIRALALKGEIITTPFSYVASTSSIVWENCEPVFVDIDPETLNIDDKKIESAITKRTSAILAVHVYGNPCKVESIGRIAKKYNLKVIYDAAHAFGVKYKGRSILNYGDYSVLSFHATKIFHTGEGGAVVAKNNILANNISYLRNFGHEGPDLDIHGLGTNAKLSELHAAMGLSVLPKFKRLVNQRRKVTLFYDKSLKDLPISKPKFDSSVDRNFIYYPVIFETEHKALEVKKYLNEHDIYPRRYFYPYLGKLNYVKAQDCPVAESISKRVLCLPLYNELELAEVRMIVKLIKKGINAA